MPTDAEISTERFVDELLSVDAAQPLLVEAALLRPFVLAVAEREGRNTARWFAAALRRPSLAADVGRLATVDREAARRVLNDAVERLAASGIPRGEAWKAACGELSEAALVALAP